MNNIIKYCDYGCGQVAKYTFKNGKNCCSYKYQKCPENKRKVGIKSKGRPSSRKGITGTFQHTEESKVKIRIKLTGKSSGMKGKIPWNKGLTKNIDSRVFKYGKSISNTKKIQSINGELIPWNKNKKANPLKDEHKKLISKKLQITKKDPNCGWYNTKVRKKLSEYMLNGGSQKALLGKYETIIKDKKSFSLYKKLVNRFTAISCIEKFTIFELKTRGCKKELNHMQIDHIFSISKGFKLGILPQIIGSKSNIRLIKCELNMKKSGKCDIRLEDLFEKYDEEIKEKPKNDR